MTCLSLMLNDRNDPYPKFMSGRESEHQYVHDNVLNQTSRLVDFKIRWLKKSNFEIVNTTSIQLSKLKVVLRPLTITY